MARQTAPPAVYAALAQRMLRPEDLRSFEISGDDLYLHLKSGSVIRVEISSLPVIVQTRLDVPEPEVTEKPKARRAKAKK